MPFSDNVEIGSFSYFSISNVKSGVLRFFVVVAKNVKFNVFMLQV